MAEPSEAIRFTIESKQDDAASRAAGRPIFKDVEYIEIRLPGDRLLINHFPVEAEHRQRYARQYQHWKQTQQDPTSGTPLKEWAPLARSQVEYLAYSGIKTVEDLAGATDGTLQLLGAGYLSLSQKARDFIAKAKGDDVSATLRHQMEQLQASNLALQDQVRVLAAKAQAKEDSAAGIPMVVQPVAMTPAPVETAPAAKRRGRPPKSAAQES